MVTYTSYEDAEEELVSYMENSIAFDQPIRAFICYHMPENEMCYEMVGLPSYPANGGIGGPGFDSVYLTKKDAYKISEIYDIQVDD